MNLRTAVFDPQNDNARLNVFYALQTWTPLAEEYPADGLRVLVRMLNGSVEIGDWDATDRIWNHSPYHAWEIPDSWTALPLSHGSD